MNYISNLIELITAFRAESRQDAITPDSLGSLLHKMVGTEELGSGNNPEEFPEWHSSATAELYTPSIFENKKRI